MVVHTLVVSAIAVVAMLIWAAALSLGMGPASLAPVVWVLVGAMPFLLLRECVRYFTFAHLQFTLAVAIDVTVAVVQLGGLLLLGLFGMLSPANGLSRDGGRVWRRVLRLVHRRQDAVSFRARADRGGLAAKLAARQVGRGKLSAGLHDAVDPSLDPLQRAWGSGDRRAGRLHVGGRAGEHVCHGHRQLPDAEGRQWRSPRGGTTELCRVLWGTAAVYAVVVGAFCLLLALTGDRLAIALLQQQVCGDRADSPRARVGVLANTVGITAGNGLWAIDRPHANFAADVCVLGVTLVLAFRLVYPLAVIGMAIATLAGTVVGSLVRCVTLLRCIRSISCEQMSSDRCRVLLGLPNEGE